MMIIFLLVFTPEDLSIVGAREVPACIQSYNHHILNVSDSKQVIFQVSKDSCFLSSDRVNERTNERNGCINYLRQSLSRQITT